jgi:hypothetical protein
MLAGIGSSAALAVVERDGAALQARFAARADNKADAARLRARASEITDVEALLKDRRTLQVVLESFQLESEIDKRGILRRVLTEDPAEETSLVNRLADPRWKQLASAFATRRTLEIGADALARTAPADLAKLERNRIAGLDFLQVQALTAEQIAALSPSQVAAISTEAISGMDAADVAALSGEQVAALSPAQMRALFVWQIDAIEPADIARLGTAQLRALTPGQLASLQPDQMAALTPDQIAAFSKTQAAVFGDAQRAALSEANRALLAIAPYLPEEEPAGTQLRPLDDARLLDRVIAGAMTNRFEKAMGESNPGMREALYFRRMAGQVTSVVQLMADSALTEVARGALGLPASFAALEFDQQRAILERRLDVTKLQDPKEVARMAQRYAATRNDAPATSPVLALFGVGVPGLESLVGARISFSA